MQIELAQARALGKVILPVICEPLGDVYVLPEVQAVDLIDWKADGLSESKSNSMQSLASWREDFRSILAGRLIPAFIHSRLKMRRSISDATMRCEQSSSILMDAGPAAARRS